MRLGQAGEKGQAREGLRSRSVAHVVVIGAGFAEAGGLQIDDARIDLAQFVVTEAPLFHLAGAEVFADSVGVTDHPLEQFAALGMVQVEGDAVFAWVGVVVVGAAIKVAAVGKKASKQKKGATVAELPVIGGVKA